MINQKKSLEATAKIVSPAYIQHNPLIAEAVADKDASTRNCLLN